jgi:hypothetical protein
MYLYPELCRDLYVDSDGLTEEWTYKIINCSCFEVGIVVEGEGKDVT